MLELRNELLIESLASAMETMAFISPLPGDGEIELPSEPVLVSVKFTGARQGRIEMVTSRQLGRMLVENTVGCDPSDTLILPSPEDPLIELINITCGMHLKCLGVGAGVDMSVPTIAPFDDSMQWRAFVGDGGGDVVMAEGVPVAIRVVEES